MGSLQWETQIVGALHQLQRTTLRDARGTITIEWSEAHEEFHNALVAGCPNRWLLKLRDTLYGHSERYRRLSVTRLDHRDIDAEHAGLAQAALDRDPQRATELMADHLNRTADAGRAWFAEHGMAGKPPNADQSSVHTSTPALAGRTTK